MYLTWKFIRNKPVVASPQRHEGSEGDYAIIVTAFQQTTMLPAVVKSLLALNYSNYVIYIVADDCKITDDLNFEDKRVVLLLPPRVLASNTASHFYAIDHFIRDHNRVTIIDSDNLVDTEYLHELNIWFSRGFEAVQGIRMAKNMDSTIACLDAARDIYYHFYDGKLLFNLNSSATLSGSGMAFTTTLYKSCLGPLNIKGAGFDKVLQAEILKRNLRIAFAENAIVYDEKTSQSTQLVNQRARWINTWFKYFKFGFEILLKGIKNRSANQMLFGLVLLRPPLFIFILLSGLFMLINLFVSALAVGIWFAAFLLFLLGFLIALNQSNADDRIYQSLKSIPTFIFLQLRSLLKSKNANRTSIATTHYHKRTNDDL
ncbi:glycosyltransferase [Pedobacter sp.]|uniref:glycosyltransferase n=1 Tax=Pedobacter sp. TaxID=1411316 RepID=UPI003D7F2FEB